jgi:hypothetical protein
MNTFHPKRIWFWIAVAAVTIAVIALLLPHHGNTADHQAWLAILPVFFVGLIAPLSLPLLSAILTVGHAPQAPALAPSFQRPPPARLA